MSVQVYSLLTVWGTTSMDLVDLPSDLHNLILQNLTTGREKDIDGHWCDITQARRLELQQLIDKGIERKMRKLSNADRVYLESTGG